MQSTREVTRTKADLDALLVNASAHLAQLQKSAQTIEKLNKDKQRARDNKLLAIALRKIPSAQPVVSVPAVSLNTSLMSSSSRLEHSDKHTLGDKWFNLPATIITPEIKRDLLLLRSRNVLDPKRHYKKDKLYETQLPKYFQIGTIVEAPHEFYSARMTRKERKQTLVDELLADKDKCNYFKRKFNELQERQSKGTGKWHKLQKQRKKKAW